MLFKDLLPIVSSGLKSAPHGGHPNINVVTSFYQCIIKIYKLRKCRKRTDSNSNKEEDIKIILFVFKKYILEKYTYRVFAK